MHVAIGLRRRLRPAVLSLSVLVLAVAAAAAGSGGRATAQPIEGTWNYGSGQILVASVGSDAYLGTIVKEATFSAGCPHPVGEKVWQLRGSGSHYEGTHEGFGPNGCTDRRTFPSTWDVTETDGAYAVKECTTITTDNNRVDCATLTRAKPPATTSKRVAFYRAYLFFLKSAYDNRISRAHARAAGTVSVPAAGNAAACLVRVTGLKKTLLYSVYADTNGAQAGKVATAGPWLRLGTFRAPSGVGTFRCTSPPPSGGALSIGVEPSHTAILISGRLP